MEQGEKDACVCVRERERERDRETERDGEMRHMQKITYTMSKLAHRGSRGWKQENKRISRPPNLVLIKVGLNAVHLRAELGAL